VPKELGDTAKAFFDQLDKDKELQAKIKVGLEKLAKEAGYNATEEQLEAELRKRWQCGFGGPHYSEPPGF